MFIVAVAFLVRGSTATGDGFSAGMTAGLAMLLQYIVFGRRRVTRRTPLAPAGPFLGLAGLALMVGVALSGPLAGAALLHHFPSRGESVAHMGRLALHTAVLFDAGIALLVFGLLVAVLEIFAEVAESEQR
ncbi:MAG: MnhB domain-containing protein [Vicinamibacteraceae bacterium]